MIEEIIVNESKTLNDSTVNDILEQNILEKSEEITADPDDDDDDTAVLDEVPSESHEELIEETHEISGEAEEEAEEEEIGIVFAFARLHKSLIFNLFVCLF